MLEGHRPDDSATVTLVDADPDAEVKLVAAMLYASSDLPELQLIEIVRSLTVEERLRIVRAYLGDRGNRRHRPGRALERVDYRFDVLSDYGAFRDLQRHRLMTIEWQTLTPHHGYLRPALIDEAGLGDDFDATMHRSAELHEALHDDFPHEAAYAVSMAYRVRYVMQMNARSALHTLELRSQPQGHPSYRSIAQEMYRLIAEEAGHHAVAEAFRFLDHSEPELGRLASERRLERRRTT